MGKLIKITVEEIEGENTLISTKEDFETLLEAMGFPEGARNHIINSLPTNKVDVEV